MSNLIKNFAGVAELVDADWQFIRIESEASNSGNRGTLGMPQGDKDSVITGGLTLTVPWMLPVKTPE